MKRQIVILANSFREGNRCIAGIDVQTGDWVRPVSPPDGGAMTRGLRNIDGREPELREIVEVSVQSTGPDVGCQPENRLADAVPWRRIGVMSAKTILRYCESDTVILHNDFDSVESDYFKTIPKEQWKSLQLVRCESVEFYLTTNWEGSKRWRASIAYGKKKCLYLGLTDPVLIERLNADEDISRKCILTISLAGPWSQGGVQPKRCYKLVEGVIEL